MKSKRILIISMMFILLFTSFSFALDIPSNVSSYKYIYYHQRDDGANQNFYFASNSPFKFEKNPNNTFFSTNDDKIHLFTSKGGLLGSETSWDGYGYKYPLYSNFNIYNTDGTVFFSKIVTPMVEVTTDGMMMTIHQVVGLIPYLIGLWIIYLAFLKAWQFLLKVLRMA